MENRERCAAQLQYPATDFDKRDLDYAQLANEVKLAFPFEGYKVLATTDMENWVAAK